MNNCIKKEYQNKRKLIDLYVEKKLNKKESIWKGTSISDNNGTQYPELVLLALEDEIVFQNFRSASVYAEIVSGVPQELGNQCWKLIRERALKDDKLEDYLQSDGIGNPETYFIKNMNRYVAPGTLRYIKIMYDIMDLFPDTKTIAEIGIGYGGQCKVITDKMNINRYDLIDLPEVVKLAEKFLRQFRTEEVINEKMNFIDGTNLCESSQGCDLVISNYAFSELCREVQNVYLDKVIRRAKHGFITWNSLAYRQLDGYSVEELLEILPNSKVIEEKPLSSKENVIIIW